MTLLGAILSSPALGAEPAPSLNVLSLATPTNFVAGDTAGEYSYGVRVDNLGAAPTDGTDITITDTLPAGLTVKALELWLRSSKGQAGKFNYAGEACESTSAGEVQTVTCTISESLAGASRPAVIFPDEEVQLVIGVVASETLAEGATLTNRAEVHGGGAPPASTTGENEIAHLGPSGEPLPAPAGMSYFHNSPTGPDGRPAGQASSHPFQMTTSFAFNTDVPPAGSGSTAKVVPAGGAVKDIRVALPPGLIGNPNAATRCTAQQFSTVHQVTVGGEGAFFGVNACPDSSAVGIVMVQQMEGDGEMIPYPLYNLVPPPGMPAQFGFQVVNLPFFINFSVRSGSDYGIDATLHNLTQMHRLTASTVVVWGTPADPRHDPVRGSCLNQAVIVAPISLGGCPAQGIAARPSLRLPSSCSSPLNTLLEIDTWTEPGAFFSDADGLPAPSGCDQLGFEPSLKARPTTDTADSPTGLAADLRIPQDEDPEHLATPDLRTATVDLPKGIAVNPSSANGLEACSPGQVGLISAPGALPVQFTPDPANCPGAAMIGSAEIDTPLIDHPLKGGVYVATPHENPFDSLLAIYVAVDDPRTGVVVKLAGDVHADPVTGRLTTTFADNPQQPFEAFHLTFFGGAGAALRSPAVCGAYTTTSTLTPWSAPASGAPATSSDTYTIDKAPSGGLCPTNEDSLPNAPSFDAGTTAPAAHAFSPLVIHLRREDGSQEFSSLSITPPPGLLGKLAGIPYCPDSSLAQAAAKTGRQEQASPSCPATSRVGTVTVGAGAGPAPYYTNGTAYLAGPYKGAPLSLAIVTPAVAGPYDLGTVVVRSALDVNPETAQITATSDAIPHILQGIPLDVRSITVSLDRPDFTLNPTNCDPMAFAGAAISTLGQAARLNRHFQVGECGSLGFKPKLKLRLKGATGRSGHPALRAVVTYPKQGTYANIARAQVGLPHAEFLDQGNLNKVCRQADLKAGTCPKSSVYGHAKAWTPLLDKPLEGPVYLGVGFGYKLPALVADLNGQIRILLVGRVDTTKRKGIRSTFEVVPDAPVSRFVLTMKGGKKYGLLENSENICRKKQRASALFDAQNGLRLHMRPVIANSCAKKGKERKKGGHHRGDKAEAHHKKSNGAS